jgi:hypothetical protein
MPPARHCRERRSHDFICEEHCDQRYGEQPEQKALIGDRFASRTQAWAFGISNGDIGSHRAYQKQKGDQRRIFVDPARADMRFGKFNYSNERCADADHRARSRQDMMRQGAVARQFAVLTIHILKPMHRREKAWQFYQIIEAMPI